MSGGRLNSASHGYGQPEQVLPCVAWSCTQTASNLARHTNRNSSISYNTERQEVCLGIIHDTQEKTCRYECIDACRPALHLSNNGTGCSQAASKKRKEQRRIGNMEVHVRETDTYPHTERAGHVTCCVSLRAVIVAMRGSR